jgi:hypothetical protein
MAMTATATLGKPCKVMATSAWIAPNGDFYHVPYCDHFSTAIALGDITGGDDLEDRGWLHCWQSGRFSSHESATQAQLNTLWDWMAAYAKTGNRHTSQIIAQELSERIAAE